MDSEEEAAARIQAIHRGRLARLSLDRRRRSFVLREATARWEREQAVIKIQVRKTMHVKQDRLDCCYDACTALQHRATCWAAGAAAEHTCIRFEIHSVFFFSLLPVIPGTRYGYDAQNEIIKKCMVSGILLFPGKCQETAV